MCSCPSLLEGRNEMKGVDASQLRVRETLLVKIQQDIIIRVSLPRLSCPGQEDLLGVQRASAFTSDRSW